MLRNAKYVVGIDEAGRGPAIGPMVYALTAMPCNQTQFLKQVGANDSKQLTERQREGILEQLQSNKHFKYLVRAVSAQEIS